MKRTISLLVALTMLLAFAGIPVSAAASPPSDCVFQPFASSGCDTALGDAPEEAANVALPEHTVHAPELDKALNVSGGVLQFYTPEEAAGGYYPWALEEHYAKSTNQGVDRQYEYDEDIDDYYDIPSVSLVKTTVEAKTGDILYFRYKVSSHESDCLRFYVDEERVEKWSGDVDWSVYICQLESGKHELQWEYDKDYGNAALEDTAYLDDVYLGTPIPVSGVELQETATVPGYRQTRLSWNVLPDVAYNRDVTFTSSDERIATVDEYGVVTGVTQGEAVITIETKEGGFTDTCRVTVTGDQMPVQLYGFAYYLSAGITDGGPAWRDKAHWYTFTDTDPGAATEIGVMPESTEDEPVRVLCAELVDGTVYGYTADGRFFSMNFDALQRGEFSVEYQETECGTYEDFYPTEMAYDRSTGTMYIVNYLHDLFEVDLKTGEIDRESHRRIYGELPGAKEGLVEYGMDYILGLAIDLEGEAYVMIAGLGPNWGGNGCSRLAKLNLETGEYTVIGQTTAQAYQEQSMCFDDNTGKLYWAQTRSPYSPEVMNLFIVDTETAALEDCGKITEFGAGIKGLFIPTCTHSGDVKKVEAKAPSCTESGNIAYWQCKTCGKYFSDETLTAEIFWEDTFIPALGHQTELRNVKEATCTKDGYTGDEVCTVCGQMIKQGQVVPASCSSKDFTDLDTNRWYHVYTDYVIAQNLMKGVGEHRFAPDAPLTRGMLMTTLYRLADSPQVDEPSTFTDVPKGQYFTDAVAWGEGEGIVKGVTATTFNPNGAVSREQAATFLYRYVTEYLEQEPAPGANLSRFKDAGQVSGYAQKAMAWAVAEGFLEGYGDGTVGPQNTLTRAQMAKLLTILDQNF